MALDLPGHRCRIALLKRFCSSRAELREGFSSECASADAVLKPPFVITQVVVLAIFILIALIAVIKFRPGTSVRV
jgi:hypothetical protein